MEENGRKYHGYKEGKYVLPVDEVSATLFSLVSVAEELLMSWILFFFLWQTTDFEQRELDRQSV